MGSETGRLSRLDALEVFARVLALVQHFSVPAVAAGYDWSSFTTEHVSRFAQELTPPELAEQLQRTFGSLDSELLISSGRPDRPARPLSGEVSFVVHVPFGDRKRSYLLREPILVSTVLHAPDLSTLEVQDLPEIGTSNAIFPGWEPYVEALPGGLYASLPLVRQAAARAPFEGGPSPVTEPPRTEPLSDAVRYASIMQLWGTLHHLYPLWECLEVNWPEHLHLALQEAPAAETAGAFRDLLLNMTAPLTDAHVFVLPADQPRQATPSLPFMLEVIDGALIISNVESNIPLPIGAELLVLDSQAVWPLFERYRDLVSGRVEVQNHSACLRLLATPDSREVAVTVRELGGGTRTEKVTSRPGRPPHPEPRPDNVSFLPGDVLYVDWTRLQAEDLSNVLEQLPQVSALIVDARGYPTDTAMDLLPHLSEEPLTAPPFLAPVITRPDRQGLTWKTVPPMHFPPAEPHFGGEVAFLINANGTQSYAESLLGVVEKHTLGARVGSATSGANGVVTHLRLPSGHLVRWTGWKVLRGNGEPILPEGIPPTHPVTRTLAGVRAGRDELLEAALAQWTT